jgi:hypothetical protein
VSGGDGVEAAEADERLFEAVQEVTARYIDALVANLHQTRHRECVLRFLNMNWIAGGRLAIKYEYRGRGLPEGAARDALAGSRRLECSPICDGKRWTRT